MSVKDALEMAKKNKAEIVDLKFIDVPGLWQHFSIPAGELSAETFLGVRTLFRHLVRTMVW